MEFGNHAKAQVNTLKIARGQYSGLGLSRVATESNALQILVGLGGSGCDMLREAKGLINRICCDDENKRANAKRVIYLGVDTDGTDNGPLKSAWTSSDGTPVSLVSSGPNSEIFELVNEDMLAILDPNNYTANCSQYPHIMEWLDLESRDNLAAGRSGACGVRQAGRLCLFKSMNGLLDKITSLYNAAKLNQTITKVNIFLLAGISGGTGSGTFLDMAYILRHKLDALNPGTKSRVFGYLIMPDVNEQVADSTKDYVTVNGYAALQELEYMMSLPKVGGRFHQVYVPNKFEVDTDGAPFDHVHLISHKDANGLVTDGYYQRAMAAAAQSILAFIARETQEEGTTEHSMEAHYSNVNKIVTSATIPHAERSHDYKALGTAEFPLPLDDIYKYVISLVFRGVNDLFANEPTYGDAEHFARSMSLTPDSWFSEILGEISDPFPAAGNDRSVYASDYQPQIESQYATALAGAKEAIDNRVATYESKLADNLRSRLEAAFTDLSRGPIWVNHLIIHHLLRMLERDQNDLSLKLNNITNDIVDLQQERDRMLKRKKRSEADEYMANWNSQFHLELQKVALNYLYKDYDKNNLSTATKASMALDELNSEIFRVITDLLDEVKKVTQKNTEGIVKTDKDTHNYNWSVITLPQISGIIEEMFANQNLDRLVLSFLADLLKAANTWVKDGIDVTSFLADYLSNNLREITDTGLERYLTEIYVNGGMFGTLQEALISDKGLFSWLKTQAKHLFLSDKTYTCSYLLTVPASCTNIATAAKKYCKDNGITLQLSDVRSRICMQSVACVIPLYHYSPIQGYETAYCTSTQNSLAGVHLRSFWTRKGQLTPPPGTENWFRLPSPIPARSRGNGAGAYPEAVSATEAKRRNLFRQLVKTPAIRCLPNANEDGETDYRFYHSKPWAQCGLDRLLGHNDSNLMTSGTYDTQKVETVLGKLKDMRIGGLPLADDNSGANGQASGYGKVSNILLQSWKTADNADRKEALKHKDTDAELFAQLKEKACLRIAEEYFISSMPLCMWGEMELDKYQKLDAEIARLEAISEKLGSFDVDCEMMAKLFITDSIKATYNRANASCYAYRDGKDNWEAERGRLLYKDFVIREYQLYQRMMEMKNHENNHIVDVYQEIVSLANMRYDKIQAKQEPIAELHTMLGRIADLKKLCDDHIRTYKDNLSRTNTGKYGVYDDQGLKFYTSMLAQAETLEINLRGIYSEELAPVAKPTAVTTPVTTPPAQGWTCPTCGKVNPDDVNFCPADGTKKPAPAPQGGWTCPVCGKVNPDDVNFCPNDGTKKPAPAPQGGWTCPACGKVNPDNVNFCPNDGTKKPAPAPQGGWTCPVCGTAHPDSVGFCPNDGTKKPASAPQGGWTCPVCGTAHPDSVGFCPNDGTKKPASAAPSGWICPACGTAHPDSVGFCPNDGTRKPSGAPAQPAPRFCPSCGTKSTTPFCPSCGTKI